MSNNGGRNGESIEETSPGRNTVQDRSHTERTADGPTFTFEDIPSQQPRTTTPIPPDEPNLSRRDVPPEFTPNSGTVPGGDISRPIPLEGVVTLVQRTEEEPPTNWYRILSKGIMTIFLLPVFLTFGLVSLAFSIAFAIIGFQALSSIFNPVSWMTALFEFMEVYVLGRLQRSSQHTVYRGLIRDVGDRVFAFYLHGVLTTGLLVDGHRVRLFGEWHRANRSDEAERGTLFVSRGEDLTTGSSITSCSNGWRPVFFVLLVILFGVLASGVVYSPQFTQWSITLFNSIHK